jgi:uncharacterized protein (TIGR02271 family)
MTQTRGAVAGLFQDEERAEKAIQELKQAGFSGSDIGVATQNRESSKTDSFWEKVSETFGKRERPEAAVQLRESLVQAGVTPAQAQYLDSRLAAGGMLITVHGDAEDLPEAREILQTNGADIGQTAASATPATTTPATATEAPASGERHIQLLGEILRVHKERVQRGEVRLRKEVVTESQNIEVPVSHEELIVERAPGKNREASGAQIGSGDKEIRIPLSEERVHVEKKPVVNEEIRVGKREVQGTEQVKDQVRHEELRTEGDVDEAEKLKQKEKGKRVA